MHQQRSIVARSPALLLRAVSQSPGVARLPALRAFSTVPGGAPEEEKKKKKPKFADLFREHGPVFAVYYVSVWTMTGGLLYGLLQSGVMGPTVALDLVRTLHLDSFINVDSISASTGNLALALMLNEAAEIVRLPFIVLTTPIVSRGWRRYMGERPPGGIASRLSSAFDKYGKFAFSYWISLYVVCGAGCYSGLELLGPEASFDIIQQIAQRTHLDSFVTMDSSQLSTVPGKLAAVIVLNEMLELVRIPLVLTTTPTLYRWWNKGKV